MGSVIAVLKTDRWGAGVFPIGFDETLAPVTVSIIAKTWGHSNRPTIAVPAARRVPATGVVPWRGRWPGRQAHWSASFAGQHSHKG